MSVPKSFGTDHENIEFVDFRFVDLAGRAHHITLPATEVDADIFVNGAFDLPRSAGLGGIEESDMVMMPDPESVYVDPFTAHATLIVMSNIYTPDGERYERDLRSIAHKAEEYLQAAAGRRYGCFLRPRIRILYLRRRALRIDHELFFVDSEEAAEHQPQGRGRQPRIQSRRQGRLRSRSSGGTPQQDIRSEMVRLMQELDFASSVITTKSRGRLRPRSTSPLSDTLTKTADKPP